MNTDASEDLQSQYILYHATISYLASMIFCGTIFNTIALKNAVRVSKTEENMVLINSFVCQLLISLFAIPLDLFGVITDGLYLSTFVCPFLAFIHTMFGLCCFYGLVALAAMRYYSSKRYHPLLYEPKAATYITSRYTKTIWGFSFLVSVNPLIGKNTYVTEAQMISCAPDWTARDGLSLFYNCSTMVLGFIIPSILICFLHGLSMQRSLNNVKNAQTNPVISTIEAQNDVDRWYDHRKVERSKTLMVQVMTLSFYITWTPYAIESTLTMIGFNVSHDIKIYAILLTKFGVVINPLLFGYFERVVKL